MKAGTFARWLLVIAALSLVGAIIYGYLARPGWVGVTDKKVRDYLELLIVPAALALGVYWLNKAQREREMEIVEHRSQDEALQAYLDQMTHLITDKERPVREAQPGDNLSSVARARTLTVLPGLDSSRKASVV
jgi:hypothetical protein